MHESSQLRQQRGKRHIHAKLTRTGAGLVPNDGAAVGEKAIEKKRSIESSSSWMAVILVDAHGKFRITTTTLTYQLRPEWTKSDSPMESAENKKWGLCPIFIPTP